MALSCIHCLVSGKVQGVWYRANTQKEAQKLGVTGWVRNLPDGRVEVLACGEEAVLEKLKKWLWKGPVLAKVKDVVIEEQPLQEFTEFTAR